MPTVESQKHMNFESSVGVLRRGHFRWNENVFQKDDEDWVKKVMSYEANGKRKEKTKDKLENHYRKGHVHC